MPCSHIRYLYPFTLIIKKTTEILKKHFFANILSHYQQLKKIRLKKVYILFNNSKSAIDEKCMESKKVLDYLSRGTITSNKGIPRISEISTLYLLLLLKDLQ